MRNDFLAHHGILGMKWGVRRYQNPDGSLTPAGRERYGVAEGGSVDDIRSAWGIKNRTKDLKKAIKKNEKARGRQYSKIANNPENFLGWNKKHAKKIEEHSENIRKGEAEIERLLQKAKSINKEADEYKKIFKEWNNAEQKYYWGTDSSKSKELRRKAEELGRKEAAAQEALRAKGYSDNEIGKMMDKALKEDPSYHKYEEEYHKWRNKGG